jgi:hypothetical protein
LVETPMGEVFFRPPETLAGMYRYYLRLRRELERTDALFPETRDVHRRFGSRTPDLLARAGVGDRIAWTVFHACLSLCRVRYRADRFLQRHGRGGVRDAWQPIPETKEW